MYFCQTITAWLSWQLISSHKKFKWRRKSFVFGNMISTFRIRKLLISACRPIRPKSARGQLILLVTRNTSNKVTKVKSYKKDILTGSRVSIRSHLEKFIQSKESTDLKMDFSTHLNDKFCHSKSKCIELKLLIQWFFWMSFEKELFVIILQWKSWLKLL